MLINALLCLIISTIYLLKCYLSSSLNSLMLPIKYLLFILNAHHDLIINHSSSTITPQRYSQSRKVPVRLRRLAAPGFCGSPWDQKNLVGRGKAKHHLWMVVNDGWFMVVNDGEFWFGDDPSWSIMVIMIDESWWNISSELSQTDQPPCFPCFRIHPRSQQLVRGHGHKLMHHDAS